jgi:hypothetical protein
MKISKLLYDLLLRIFSIILKQREGIDKNKKENKKIIETARLMTFHLRLKATKRKKMKKNLTDLN